jgi:hypothetical protein
VATEKPFLDQRLDGGGDLSLNAPLAQDGRKTYMEILPATDALEERVADDNFRGLLTAV